MNRIAISLNAHGEFSGIASDGPVEVFIVDPNCPSDRVYQYESVEVGVQHVQALIVGYAVGHAHDGRLLEGDGTGRRPPSKPILKAVK
jgi:hypothetical protein